MGRDGNLYGTISRGGSADCGYAFKVTLTGRQTQSLVFPPIDPALTKQTLVLKAAATSKLPILYRVLEGPALVDGNRLTLTGAGRVTVSANQPGNLKYLPAREVKINIVVQKRDQKIGFPFLGYTQKGPTVPLGAKSTSGLPVVYIVKEGPATISNNQVILNGPGEVRIAATQPGDNSYNPAKYVYQEFLSTAPVPTTPPPTDPGEPGGGVIIIGGNTNPGGVISIGGVISLGGGNLTISGAQTSNSTTPTP